MVLEGTRTSMWPLTPMENLVYYGNLRNVTGKALRERAHNLLDFIGLKDKKNVQVRRLSRGQKQKLAICIALISDPRVLLLDEPTTGLDVQSARAIKDKGRRDDPTATAAASWSPHTICTWRRNSATASALSITAS